jgi:glutathione S-transferase
MKLVIGNKNYSTWSMRPWLVMRHAGIPFEEVKLSFNAPDFAEQVKRHSPAGKVPVLLDGELVVWDSLAIAEYLAERFPEKALWPDDRAARARARSACAEMHSGFAELRRGMPMNCEVSLPAPPYSLTVRKEAARLVELWLECRRRAADGPFLFGRFSVADAFFAPVALRFAGFSQPLPPVAAQYRDTLLGLPAVQQWVSEARAEHDFVPHDEPYRDHPDW